MSSLLALIGFCFLCMIGYDAVKDTDTMKRATKVAQRSNEVIVQPISHGIQVTVNDIFK